MKKGFTLVELAIVLVIIGLIMGMAIKGKQMIDIARFTREIHRVVKLQTALASYIASGTPYVRKAGSSWGDIDMTKLMERGGISQGDLRSMYFIKDMAADSVTDSAAHWLPMECHLVKQDPVPVDAPNGWIATRIDSTTNTNATYCARILHSTTTSRMVWVAMPLQAQCGIENMLDDQKVLFGQATRPLNGTASATNLTNFTDAEYRDCLSLPSEESARGSGTTGAGSQDLTYILM